LDLTLSGSTINLESRDLRRLQDWLRHQAGIDPDALTARALDRCTCGNVSYTGLLNSGYGGDTFSSRSHEYRSAQHPQASRR
jgi:hypothetical protein